MRETEILKSIREVCVSEEEVSQISFEGCSPFVVGESSVTRIIELVDPDTVVWFVIYLNDAIEHIMSNLNVESIEYL